MWFYHDTARENKTRCFLEILMFPKLQNSILFHFFFFRIKIKVKFTKYHQCVIQSICISAPKFHSEGIKLEISDLTFE